MDILEGSSQGDSGSVSEVRDRDRLGSQPVATVPQGTPAVLAAPVPGLPCRGGRFPVDPPRVPAESPLAVRKGA